MKARMILTAIVMIALITACGNGDSGIHNPMTAPHASIDRFSPEAGTLFVRDGSNGLPGPNEPINFDMAPFITQGLGPDGQSLRYYNFDVMPEVAAPIFALFYESSGEPVPGQLNIVDDIPGDDDYNDFWHVHKVYVPDDYQANSIASLDDLMAAGFTIERTNMIVNCPIVPAGSTASLRFDGGDTGLVQGWFRNQIVEYFNFNETMLVVDLPPTGHPHVPDSDIYVMFNINPDPENPASGPPSGFMMEPDSVQTHNVTETIPGDADYSPFWDVQILDNAAFDSVSDLDSALAAPLLEDGPLVNCPIVAIP